MSGTSSISGNRAFEGIGGGVLCDYFAIFTINGEPYDDFYSDYVYENTPDQVVKE